MKILFFDDSGLRYDLSTPLFQPLGGTQSAICYLANQLSKKHQVYLSLGDNNLPNEVDIVVGSSNPILSPGLKARYPNAKFVLWTGQSYDQPINQILFHDKTRTAWDQIVCVSEWHMKKFEMFGSSNLSYIPNGVPEFYEYDGRIKTKTVIYSSTPFRGLIHFLKIWPLVLEREPNANLHVYSGMSVYQQSNNEYDSMFNELKKLKNVEVFGPVGQIQLSEALKSAMVFGYPNDWEETGCIALLEAMAAGCNCVTTQIGALIETGAGFNQVINSHNSYEAFADGIQENLNIAPNRLQIDHTKTHYWETITKQWETLFRRIL